MADLVGIHSASVVGVRCVQTLAMTGINTAVAHVIATQVYSVTTASEQDLSPIIARAENAEAELSAVLASIPAQITEARLSVSTAWRRAIAAARIVPR